MESQKKTSCSCFCFLRKNSSNKKEKTKIREIDKNISAEVIFGKHQEENYSQDHSLVTTQKIFSPSQNLKSTIVAPSCRTPQLHNLHLMPCMGNPEKNINQIPEIRVLQVPNLDFHQVLLEKVEEEKNFEEIKSVKSGNFRLFCKENEKSADSGHQVSKSSNAIQEILKDLVQSTEEVKVEENLEISHLNCSISEDSVNSFHISDSFDVLPVEPLEVTEIIVNPAEEVFIPQVPPQSEVNFSPCLSEDRFIHFDKASPHLEISPIKSMASLDDYSDIIAAFNIPDYSNTANIPDLFIRAVQKPKQLPMLKPTTPHYFSKRSAMPRLRKDNLALIDKLI